MVKIFTFLELERNWAFFNGLMIVFSERHLRRILKEYIEYYHQDRTHLGLDKDTPSERSVQEKPSNGKVVALPRVGGLHHRYIWKKAA